MVQLTRGDNKCYYVLSSLILFFLFLTFTLPIVFGLLGVFITSVGYIPNFSSDLTLHFFFKAFSIPGLTKSVFLTIFVGLMSTVFSLFLSQLILLKTYETRFYKYITKLITPLLAFPHLSMAVGISFIFSSSGLLVRFFSFFFLDLDRPPNLNFFPDNFGFFLILGLILKETPFFLLMSMNALTQFPAKNYLDLCKTLNHRSISSWFLIIFPHLYKRIKISIIIVLVYSATVVDMAYILAPSTPSTLSIRIIELYQQPEIQNICFASSLCIIQLVIVLLLIFLIYIFEKKFKFGIFVRLYINCFPRKIEFFEKKLFILSISIMSVSILSILMIFFWSISEYWNFPEIIPSKLTFKNLTNFVNDFSSSILNSFFIAFLSSFFSFLIILIWLEITENINFVKSKLEFLFLLPILIPELSLLLGINYIFTYYNINGKFFALVWVVTLYVLPYTFLIFAPAYRTINRKFIHVAKTLGKSDLRIFTTIKMPLLSQTIILTIGVGMLVSIGLYTPVYIIGDNIITTLSIEVINLSSSGNRKDLAVATILQMFLPLLILASVFYINKISTRWRY